MTREDNLFQKLLKDNGYSLTKARQDLFATLQNHNALSMRQLTALLQTYDRATIYRAVKLFESLGIVSRLQLGWKYKMELSDNFAHHHHHLSCNRCGRVVVLPENQIIENQIQLASHTQGFQASDHQLEIRGLCAACQQLEQQPKSPEDAPGLTGSLTLPHPA